METTVVLNHFPNTNISRSSLYASKLANITLFVVAMVTKLYFVLQNLTFLCFNLHSSMCSNKHKYQEFFSSVYGMENGIMPLSAFTT